MFCTWCGKRTTQIWQGNSCCDRCSTRWCVFGLVLFALFGGLVILGKVLS